jgi:N4-gp56 family major capsid protein
VATGPFNIASGASLGDVVQTAYDRLAYFALRPQLYFDAVADVQPTRQAMPGAAVKFTIMADLAVASTAINESTDLASSLMTDSQVTLTLAEYGNVVTTTAKLRGTSFIDVDPIVANLIGFNAGKSLDTIARDVLKLGSNVRYATGGSTLPTSRATVEADDTITGNNVRRALADLRGANVSEVGNGYVAYIHPDVSYDLRGGTGGANWRDPHTYSQPNEIMNGEIGMFEGFRFVETPQAPVFADAGSSTTLTDVYRTIFMGRQGLAKAYSNQDGNGAFPKVVAGPVVDSLRRFVPLGWYWLGTYGLFRQEAVRAVESSSSIGTNA